MTQYGMTLKAQLSSLPCRAQLPLLLIKDVRAIIPNSLRIKVGVCMPADTIAAEVGINSWTVIGKNPPQADKARLRGDWYL